MIQGRTTVTLEEHERIEAIIGTLQGVVELLKAGQLLSVCIMDGLCSGCDESPDMCHCSGAVDEDGEALPCAYCLARVEAAQAYKTAAQRVRFGL